MMENLMSSAPDLKTVAQFLVINYASDFLVIGGGMYVIGKIKEKIAKLKKGQGNHEADEKTELSKAVASLIDKDPETVKELVNFVSSEVEKRIEGKMEERLNSYLKEIEKDLNALKSIAENQDKQVHVLINSIADTINKTKNMRKRDFPNPRKKKAPISSNSL